MDPKAIVYLDNLLAKYGQQVINVRIQTATKNKASIYVGRGSFYGNPFVMKAEENRGEATLRFRDYVMSKLQDPLTRYVWVMQLKRLKGQTLHCFCNNGTCSRDTGGKWCHALVLLSACDYVETSKL